jgi:hypothetical protein
MRLPDETQTNVSAIDNSTTNANTVSELNPVTRSSKKHKDKTKKTDDNVVEMGLTSQQADDNLPATKKRRRNNKAKQDDVTEGTLDNNDKKERRRKKKKKQEQVDEVHTTQ